VRKQKKNLQEKLEDLLREEITKHWPEYTWRARQALDKMLMANQIGIGIDKHRAIDKIANEFRRDLYRHVLYMASCSTHHHNGKDVYETLPRTFVLNGGERRQVEKEMEVMRVHNKQERECRRRRYIVY